MTFEPPVCGQENGNGLGTRRARASAGVRGVAAQHCGGIRLSVNVNSHVTFGKDGPAACYPSEEGVPGDSDE